MKTCTFMSKCVLCCFVTFMKIGFKNEGNERIFDLFQFDELFLPSKVSPGPCAGSIRVKVL